MVAHGVAQTEQEEEKAGGPAGYHAMGPRIARQIAAVLATPMDKLGIKPANLTERQREAYTVLMCEALNTLLPVPNLGSTQAAKAPRSRATKRNTKAETPINTPPEGETP